METETLVQIIQAGLPDASVEASGGGSHFEARIVSPSFAGLTPLQRERLVMATVRDQVASGELHALSLKTFTPEQWAARSSA